VASQDVHPVHYSHEVVIYASITTGTLSTCFVGWTDAHRQNQKRVLLVQWASPAKRIEQDTRPNTIQVFPANGET
jgi:hypothetical protein